MYYFKQSTIFGSCVPFLYGLLKVPLKWIYSDSNDKINHVGIMSAIGAIKGATISYNANDGYLQSSSSESLKSFIKYSTTSVCTFTATTAITNKVQVKLFIKPMCSALGAMSSSLYSNGFDDLSGTTHKSISAGIVNSIAEAARKQLIPQEINKLTSPGLWDLVINEIKLLPSNIGHSITLSAGKEISNLLLIKKKVEEKPLNHEQEYCLQNEQESHYESSTEMCCNSTPNIYYYSPVEQHYSHTYLSESSQ